MKGAQEIIPQWTSFYTQRVTGNRYDSDAEDDKKLRHSYTKSSKKPKKRLAIADFAEEEYADMPDLQTVSNSSEDYSSNDDSVSEVDYLDSDSDESGYNTEQEQEIRELLREAMDVAHEGDWFNPAELPPEPTKVDESRHANPFLRLLGSLRGRFQAIP